MKKIVIRFNAPVILTFALLSLLALLLGNWTGGTATTQFFSVYRSSLADPLTYVRFFGHVLGHTGYEHYMGNMLLLLLVGPGLEEKYGSGTMVWMIALTALVTGLVHFIFFPHSALLGASGVVFMMIVLSSFTAARRGEIPVTLPRRSRSNWLLRPPSSTSRIPSCAENTRLLSSGSRQTAASSHTPMGSQRSSFSCFCPSPRKKP